MSTYLWIDLGSISIPLLSSFHPRIRFHRNWYALLPALLVLLALFVPWDAAFTRLGIWGFNPGHVCGIQLFGLPLEELLFFVCIPYACLFTYHALYVLGVSGRFLLPARPTTAALAGVLLLVIVFFPGRAYTASAFGALAFLLLLLDLWLKPVWLGRAYFTYLLLLAPFMLVNGLLTGSFLGETIVWYNEKEILGLRIGTIPVEDVFYGLLLFLLAVAVYEARLARGKPVHHRP